MKNMIATTSDLSSASLVVDVQEAHTDDSSSEIDEPPSARLLTSWATSAYSVVGNNPAALTIRVCGTPEMREMNREFRGKNQPTNVLSFPSSYEEDLPPELLTELGTPTLGDILLCHSVIVDEAQQQAKSLNDHYAHMVVHGVLHLCGYDHQADAEAEIMESREVAILTNFGIANPYN